MLGVAGGRIMLAASATDLRRLLPPRHAASRLSQPQASKPSALHIIPKLGTLHIIPKLGFGDVPHHPSEPSKQQLEMNL